MAKRGENIYKRKDGRYEGRYVVGKTQKGKTKFGYVYGRQYSEVRQALLLKKAERLANISPRARRCTLLQWLPHYMESELRGRVKESSYQVYLNQANRHLLPALGGMLLSDLTPGLLHDFVRGMEARGLAHSTVRGIYRLLSASLQVAQEEGLIRKNPCRKIRFQQKETAEPRVLTLQEQESLRQNAGTEDLPTLLGLYTGMRLGEICALKWSDIDWEQRTITVRRTAQRVAKWNGDDGKRTMLMIGTPKTRRSCRVLPVADFLLVLLRQRFEAQEGGDYVFGTDGHAAEPRTVQRRFKKLAARLGIANVHFHTLRHSFSTRLLELGVDIKTVSELLGHSSAKITLDVYAHSLPQQQRRAIDRLAA